MEVGEAEVVEAGKHILRPHFASAISMPLHEMARELYLLAAVVAVSAARRIVKAFSLSSRANLLARIYILL